METNTKVCTKCGQTKADSEENFRFLSARNRTHTVCRECERNYARTSYKAIVKGSEEHRARARQQIADYIKLYGEEIVDEAKRL